jgi:hypothetical protein
MAHYGKTQEHRLSQGCPWPWKEENYYGKWKSENSAFRSHLSFQEVCCLSGMNIQDTPKDLPNLHI